MSNCCYHGTFLHFSLQGPPVAGKKRRTGAKQAFDNEKSVRFETSEWAPHLTPKKVPRQSKLIRTAIPPLELQQASSSSQHSLDTRKISAPSQSSPIVVPDRSRQMAAFQRRRRADTRSRGHRSSTPPQVQVVGQKPAQVRSSVAHVLMPTSLT
ncbi:hypothetical protein NUW54_g14404 [Trametes sanguinea]|uniref:Uncharacterized protein n=1 Tax=Trametes sanguinea TaxID=158606 RepID=A0ACC1MDV2_9APHY|nr:hypothetical protein NUW54_g14404 [Trametes sanguinea]